VKNRNHVAGRNVAVSFFSEKFLKIFLFDFGYSILFMVAPVSN
jgi:hypothetical protein